MQKKNNISPFQKGLGLVELLVAVGILAIIVSGMATMFTNQQKETKALSEKLAALDLEKSVILMTSSQDMCKTFFTNNPTIAQVPTASLPPIALTSPIVSIANLYTDATSNIEYLSTNGASVNNIVSPISSQLRIRSIQIQNIQPFNIGNYKANLVISLQGGVREIKPIVSSILLSSTSAGASTIFTGCPKNPAVGSGSPGGIIKLSDYPSIYGGQTARLGNYEFSIASTGEVNIKLVSSGQVRTYCSNVFATGQCTRSAAATGLGGTSTLNGYGTAFGIQNAPIPQNPDMIQLSPAGVVRISKSNLLFGGGTAWTFVGGAIPSATDTVPWQ